MSETITHPTTPPVSPAALPRKNRWQKVRRWLLKLLIVVLIVGVGLLMVPTWMNTLQGRAFLLSRINERMRGRVSAADWKLSWFSGLRVVGLTVATPAGKPVVTCENVRTDLTLLNILLQNYDVGDTVLTGCSINLEENEDGTTNLSRIFGGGTKGGGSARPTTAQWRRATGSVRGVLQLQNGDVEIKRGHSTVRVGGISARVEIAAHGALVRLRIRAGGASNAAATGGPAFITGGTNQMAVEAVLPPLPDWTQNPLPFAEDLDFQARAMPVEPWLGLLGFDARWEKSMGPMVDELDVVSHGSADPSHPLLLAAVRLRGNAGSLRADFALTPPESGMAATWRDVEFRIPQRRDYGFFADLALSPPLRDLLGYVNPALLCAAAESGRVAARVNRARMQLGDWNSLDAQGTLTVRDIKLAASGVIKPFVTFSGGLFQDVPLTSPPLLVAVSGGQVSCDNFALELPRDTDLSFAGTVGLDRRVNLIATVSGGAVSGNELLGSATYEVPIGGTLDKLEVDTRRLDGGKR